MDNNKKLRRVITQNRLTQKKAAEIISKESGDKVAWRTVQSWLAEPDRISARRCPGWAIKMLESGVAGMGGNG